MHTGGQSGDHESDFTGGLLSMSAIKGRPYEQLIKHQLSQRYRKWQRCSTLICAAARRCLFHTLVLRAKMTFRILLGKNFKLCRPNEKRLDVLNATESKNMWVLLYLQNGELVGYIANLALSVGALQLHWSSLSVSPWWVSFANRQINYDVSIRNKTR